MRNHFRLKYVIGLFVVLFASSLNVEAGYAEQLGGPKRSGANIAEKVILLSEDHPRIHAAIEARKRHAESLMKTFGVVGTGIGISRDGEPVVRVFTTRAGIAGIPERLDDVSVETKVTGRFYALQDPPEPLPAPYEWWPRPVPIGVSTGHPDITAGTIGARVTDGTNVYALSNNHVYANINSATLGDSALQPGPWDHGIDPDDAIGTLNDFEWIQFRYRGCGFLGLFWCYPENRIDAAIALSSVNLLGNGTPLYDQNGNEGYGVPNSAIRSALLGMPVMKFGRTTGMTYGTVDAINATIDVCYDEACLNVARFVDQIIITPGSFSGGGDSGSLIVTHDENKNPVGLLFAGSTTNTVANPIDRILSAFGVNIDSTPAEPFTDIGIASVNVPASVPNKDEVSVVVIVKNFGNQNVTDNIIVSLVSDNATPDDTGDDIALGFQTIQGGLSHGAFAELTFTWNTTGVHLGDHILTCWHDYLDQDSDNDENTTMVSVVESLTDVAITGISAPESVDQGDEIPVVVTVKNVGNKDVTGNIIVSLVSDNATPDDTGDDIALGSQTIQGGLSDGEFADLTFLWNSTGANIGSYLLTASHDLSDDVESNNVGTTTVKVEEPSVADTMHIGDLDGSSKGNRFWRARVTIMVHDAEERPLAGATVHGTFSDGPSEFTCTTGGNGTCDVKGYQLWLDCLTFTVFNLSHATFTYAPDENHDPDGDSDGNSIVVCRP